MQYRHYVLCYTHTMMQSVISKIWKISVFVMQSSWSHGRWYSSTVTKNYVKKLVIKLFYFLFGGQMWPSDWLNFRSDMVHWEIPMFKCVLLGSSAHLHLNQPYITWSHKSLAKASDFKELWHAHKNLYPLVECRTLWGEPEQVHVQNME